MTRNAILYGDVYPSNPPITIARRDFELRNDLGLVGRVQFMIHDSKVIVAGSFVNELHIADFTQSLRQIAEVHIDYYCFLNSESRQFLYSFIFDADSKSHQYIGVKWPAQHNLVDDCSITFDDIGLLTDEGSHSPFKRFIRNLREAKVGAVQDTAFFCNRAIESLMQFFRSHEGLNEADAWARLDAITTIDRTEYENAVRELNRGPRHGADVRREGDFMSAAERMEAVRITSTIGFDFAKWFKEQVTR